MAVLSGDHDIDGNRIWFRTFQAGSGDYYLQMQRESAAGIFEPTVAFRCVMSGSRIPREVRHAMVALHRAMEKHGLNEHPSESKPIS